MDKVSKSSKNITPFGGLNFIYNAINRSKIDIEGAEKKLFESNYENWLPKTKIIMVETHDRFIPKCSYTVMNALNDYNFISKVSEIKKVNKIRGF